jgi:hypothetical protein
LSFLPLARSLLIKSILQTILIYVFSALVDHIKVIKEIEKLKKTSYGEHKWKGNGLLWPKRDFVVPNIMVEMALGNFVPLTKLYVGK